MRMLVTGGSGFIGSNLVDELIAADHEVTVVDNLSTGFESNLTDARANGAKLSRVDVREAADLRAAVIEAAPEVVFHLAAQVDVRHSVADAADDARTNVEGTINVLDAALAAGVRRVVNVSTGGAIYGDVPAAAIPTPESHPARPIAPYGVSKYCAEQYCRQYERLHGLSVVTLRLGNVYGPRQNPAGEAGVVAIFCGKARDGARATIYGDGTQTRDYVHVSDVVRGLRAAAAVDETGEINLATGRETSLLDVVAAVNAARPHSTFAVDQAEPRAGEIQRSCLDVAHAFSVLGYQPDIALVDGVRSTLASL